MKKNIVWGLIVAILGMGSSLWLLIDLEKLSGAEFVTLSLGFAAIGLIIAFAAEVQEFSIVGNGVKLKELRKGRTELFRILIQTSTELSGGLAGPSKVESRAKKFIHIFKEVEKFDCIKELKADLEKSLQVIVIAQYNKLSFIHKKQKEFNNEFTDCEKATYLYIALSDDVIRDSYTNRRPEPDFQTEKDDIIKAIDVYAELYEIKLKLDEA
ncbi:hypothetical protein VXQ92_05860 [Acinetobacter sp. 228]|uniref:hypothetical protein n=1 Tax=Acinetobacter sp. 228 TaxID=3114700 RepID=UPI003A862F4A